MIEAIGKTGFKAVEWRSEGSPHAAASKTKTGMADEAAYLDENEAPNHSYGSGGWLGTLAIFGTPASKKGKKKQKDAGVLNALSSWW